MNTQDTCPNSENGLHRYFFNKMITEFAVVDDDLYVAKIVDTIKITPVPLYQKLEYALSACACGRALKERIHYEA